jgi:glycolate oxidase
LAEKSLIGELKDRLGEAHVLDSRADLHLYSSDASIFPGVMPSVVVLPGSTEEVSAVVKLCNRYRTPFVGRGSGTNISGGAIPPGGGVVVEFSRMNRILNIDTESQRAVVEPGVINLDLKNALQPLGYTFVPDPASHQVSTLGGNAAENAGGPHCLKYGITTNHILGLELVLPSGEVADFGGAANDFPGYDLTALCVGAEGTLGLVTKLTVRLTRLAERTITLLAVFDTIVDAASAVSSIVAAGIIPATLEIMDRNTIMVVEAKHSFGYPPHADAVLVIELEGLEEEVERMQSGVMELCRSHKALEIKAAATEEESALLWAGRRNAFGAVARMKPDCYIMDGTVPRQKLPEALAKVNEICDRYRLTVANVFHAGDGNLHPLIVFDASDEDEKGRVLKAGVEILEVCTRAGGSITGEHGVGIEKREEMTMLFSQEDLRIMKMPREALDPVRLCNPDKIFPMPVRGI